LPARVPGTAAMLERCRTLLGIVRTLNPADKTTAQWILQLVGIDVSRCLRCGSQTLERVKVPPLGSLCFPPMPTLRDTS
jgi:hypothetical protein